MESNGLGAKQVVGFYFFNILIKYHKINTKYYLLKLKNIYFRFFLFSFENSYKFDHSGIVADRELLQNSGERETRSEGIGLILFTRNSFLKITIVMSNTRMLDGSLTEYIEYGYRYAVNWKIN